MALSAFCAALVERGRARPEAPAYVCGDAVLTCGELLADAMRIAAGLRARGVAPGARVALVLPAGLPFVRGFAGVTLAGAVPFAIPATLHARTAKRRA